MFITPRRIAGGLGFAASLIASANAPGMFEPPRATPVVRGFHLGPQSIDPRPIATVRSFALDEVKEVWHPEEDVAEDILFENELNPTGPEGVSLVTRIAELPAPEEAPHTPEPLGHFFLDRYLPLEGDTLRRAAARLGCIPELLGLLNDLESLDGHLDSTRSIEIYRGPVTSHRIEQGDTLWSISRRYRIPLRELIWLNRLRDLEIRAGDTLFVARGIVSSNVERRAATDLRTSELLARAKQQMRHGKEASAARTKGVRVARPIRGVISSGFGWRQHPFLKRASFHKGLDIVAPKGTPIKALYGGKVVFAGIAGAGGKSIILRHPNNLYTIYAHCAAIHVSKGDEVPQSTTIGRVGKTGQATAPHLHFAMRRGPSSLDPLPFLR